MANHILRRHQASTIALPSLRRRHLLEFGAALIAATIILVAAVAVIGSSDDVTPAVRADGLRLEALVASQYPGATPAAIAEAARWEALAAAYADYTILPQGRIAEGMRWQSIADASTRSQVTEAARLTGLADHYLGLSPALQAAADRYQGMADDMR